jgi:hypothetical protein
VRLATMILMEASPNFSSIKSNFIRQRTRTMQVQLTLMPKTKVKNVLSEQTIVIANGTLLKLK